ncbi:40S ribosomal protein [Aspergillus ochraceoroseus]|uniref:40S ribosomal protein n=1 Tax=Aspergillus ochraceoroseus TaxID=138278 RepID=A0A0F8WAH0_9EURO|nr:40S ribosomal protein [Aspergillus ochraceoroseus]
MEEISTLLGITYLDAKRKRTSNFLWDSEKHFSRPSAIVDIEGSTTDTVRRLHESVPRHQVHTESNMSDHGEVEVEIPAGAFQALPKDAVAEMGTVKLFNKWSYEDVEIRDISLTDYIQIRSPVYLPHSAGRYAAKRFRKAQCPIIERLTNSIMMNGRNNGKKLMAVRIVAHAFEIIHIMTDQNPLQVAIDAIVNCGPREDSTRIGSAGTVRRQAVDVSPLRRVNQSIALLTIGAREASFRNIKSIAECLAEELINAAKGSSNSYAIKKKDELERVAKSNR